MRQIKELFSDVKSSVVVASVMQKTIGAVGHQRNKRSASLGRIVVVFFFRVFAPLLFRFIIRFRGRRRIFLFACPLVV
jgi:hypothetical protein